MFRDPAANALAPKTKTGGLQLTRHHVDNLFFSESSPLFYLLKRGAILLRIANNPGNAVDFMIVEALEDRSPPCAKKERFQLREVRWILSYLGGGDS